jgi:hypothetical protein
MALQQLLRLNSGDMVIIRIRLLIACVMAIVTERLVGSSLPSVQAAANLVSRSISEVVAKPLSITDYLDAASRSLGLCHNGRDMNWSVRFAEYFFVNCPCCIFWRGFTIGAPFWALFGALVTVSLKRFM